MASQQQSQTVHVTVQNKSRGCGCGGFLAFLLVLGVIALSIQYWYVTVPVLLVAGGIAYWYYQRQQAKPRPPKSGPADTWLNQVAQRLVTHGFREQTRNTGANLAGVPIEGDIQLVGPDKTQLWVNLFATPDLARQAVSSLEGQKGTQQNIESGVTVVAAQGRIAYVAVRRGGRVDMHLFQQTREAVPETPSRMQALQSGDQAIPRTVEQSDVLDQIQRLADLRDSGALSNEEFEAKKTELLDRL